jgi:hypothetical protein
MRGLRFINQKLGKRRSRRMELTERQLRAEALAVGRLHPIRPERRRKKTA